MESPYKKLRNMKRLGSSPESSDVWATVCPPPREGKVPKRKQIYGKEFQEMLGKLGAELVEEEDEEEAGLGGGEKKQRLGVDQVKALERSFEKENKLEPERKNRLAEELGLQPRQVAIWFQNRRARWKTKQLEMDYGVLKSDYDSLSVDYNYLKHENKSLHSQLTELKAKLQQQARAANKNRDNERLVFAVEECPVSELRQSNSDDSLIKESGEEEDPKPNLLKAEADTVVPMSSPPSVSSLNHNTTTTASSVSSCTTSLFSGFQRGDSRAGMLGCPLPQQGMMTGTAAEEQQQGWFNFFSVDQAPTLHFYFGTDDLY